MYVRVGLYLYCIYERVLIIDTIRYFECEWFWADYVREITGIVFIHGNKVLTYLKPIE